MLEHLQGDLSCPFCDKPAEECSNCGGVIHIEIVEQRTVDGVLVVSEELDCDGCGPDYAY